MRPVPAAKVLLLLFALALLCAAPVSAWAAPTITGASAERGRDTAPDGTVSYHEWVMVYVSDPDGVADLARHCHRRGAGTHDTSLRNRSEDGTRPRSGGEHAARLRRRLGLRGSDRDGAGQVIDEMPVLTSEVIDGPPPSRTGQRRAHHRHTDLLVDCARGRWLLLRGRERGRWRVRHLVPLAASR
jgi:hypothetical protein